jgi:hypothetical protein
MKAIFTFSLACLFLLQSYSQFSIVTVDSLLGETKFKDNALLFTPEGYDEPQSSFVVTDKADDNGLTFPSLALSELALGQVTGLFQSWASFDLVFPRSIDRNPGDTIIVEFDMLYGAAGGSGEGGRTSVTLLSDLPSDGITQDNFGVPAYYFWIFNGNYSAAMSYGGLFEDNPGWNSGAGGYYYNENFGDTGTAVLFPESDDYPTVPYVKNKSGNAFFSATTWKHYTWVIAQDMMHLFWRNTGADESENEEILKMAIPKNSSIDFINETHGTFATELPPAYEWFENINGLRFWTRGSGTNEVFFSNMKITKSGTPVTTYAEFQNRPVSQRRPMADAGSYALPVLLYNALDGGTAQVTISLADGNPAHIDGFTEGVVEFNNTISDDFQLESFNLTLTDAFMSENDTLLFEITQVTGGEEFSTPGPNRFFELIIRSSGATSITEEDIESWVVMPNPASRNIKVTGNPLRGETAVAIHDITGKLVYINENYTGNEIDVTSFNNGLYIVKIFADEVVLTRKFVKN